MPLRDRPAVPLPEELGYNRPYGWFAGHEMDDPVGSSRET